MKIRTIDGNIVAERITGIEGNLDCITQKVERTDITADTINCVIDYLIDKETFKDKKRIVITSDNKNVSLCLIDNDEYRLIKTDTLNDYQKRIEELEETNKALEKLKSALDGSLDGSPTEPQDVVDAEFQEI